MGKANQSSAALPGANLLQDATGLYEGFEAYRTPSEADYQDVLTKGMVVLDTNVLLNLYRYNAETRQDFFSVLNRLGSHLWVPHQAIAEFWHNRESVLRDPRDTDSTTQALISHRDAVLTTIRTWANRVRLQPQSREELLSLLSDAFATVASAVADLADDDAREFARDTAKDPILAGLEPILRGHVGLPFPDGEHAKALEEAKRRVAAKEPPGYRDAKKPGDGATGDYFIWAQTLQEAKRRQQDVLIVTGDAKEDWWRREHGELRGPLPYLVNELRKVAGTRLFMLRPEVLLPYARNILKVSVRDESVQDIERIAEGENGGWTSETMSDFLSQLFSEGWTAQEAVIRTAALRGGLAEREVAYTLGGYGEERSLRGFTRPINRITREFREGGRIPQSAIDVLQTEYDSSGSMPAGWASGFRVPGVLIPLILDWHANWAASSREPEPEIVASALEEFRSLGHDVDEGAREQDPWGQVQWPCRSCGSSMTLVGLDGRWVAASGRNPCLRGARDTSPRRDEQQL